jgi:Fe2+ transport system protein FeoA
MPTDLPDITESELRALRIAARQMPWTNASERVERHPLGKGYVARLMDMGLLGYTGTSRGKKIEVTALAVELLRAHWCGERFSVPYGSRGSQ